MKTEIIFEGIIVPIISPCNDNEDIRFDILEEHFDDLMKTEINGLYICGGTGDGEKLTIEEREQISGLLVPATKKAGKTAIVHVGQVNLRQALRLAEHAGKAGADAIAAIPPRGGWEAAVEFYKALARTGIPVFIYYIPGLTGYSASIGDISTVLEIQGVRGIKVSDWNSFLIRQIKERHPGTVVYSGFDEMLLPGLLYGADGSIGTWSNIFPELYTVIYMHIRNGELSKALAINNMLTEFLAECWNFGVIAAFENIIGFERGFKCFRSPCAYPVLNLDQDRVRKLKEKAWGLKNILC